MSSSRHLVSGVVFVLFGTWWSFITAIRHLHSKMKLLPVSQSATMTRLGYKSTAAMPCIIMPCSSARLMPIESFIKLTIASLATFLEVYSSFFNNIESPSDDTASQQTHHFLNDNITSHSIITTKLNSRVQTATSVTMYSSFILTSLIEILVYFETTSLPERFEYACGAMTFLVEAFMLVVTSSSTSSHQSSFLEQHVEHLLVYAVLGCALFITCELFNREEVLFTIGRNLFTILQGTWRIHIGLMLHPTLNSWWWPWSLESLDESMIVAFASVAFCWHILLILMAFLVQLWLVHNFVIYLNRFNSDELILIDHFNNSRQTYYNPVNTEEQAEHINSPIGSDGGTSSRSRGVKTQ